MANTQTTDRLLTAKAVGEMLSSSDRQSDIEKWISLSCCTRKEFIAREEVRR